MSPISTPAVQQATETLVHNLLASEPFVQYQQAQARLQADPEASARLEMLALAQAEVRRQQADQTLTPAAINTLRAAQAQVQSQALIQAYARSQQAAVSFLREINTEISELLGIDFASFARRSGCC